MTKVDLNKHIWEGWTDGDFIDELQTSLDLIQRGQSWHLSMETKAEIKKWRMDNRQYYKKHIPDLVNYFCERYGIK